MARNTGDDMISVSKAIGRYRRYRSSIAKKMHVSGFKNEPNDDSFRISK